MDLVKLEVYNENNRRSAAYSAAKLPYFEMPNRSALAAENH